MKSFFKKTYSIVLLVVAMVSTSVSALNEKKAQESLTCLKNLSSRFNYDYSVKNDLKLLDTVFCDVFIPLKAISEFDTDFASALCGRYVPCSVKVCNLGLPSEITLDIDYNSYFESTFIQNLLVKYEIKLAKKISNNVNLSRKYPEIKPPLDTFIAALEE